MNLIATGRRTASTCDRGWFFQCLEDVLRRTCRRQLRGPREELPAVRVPQAATAHHFVASDRRWRVEDWMEDHRRVKSGRTPEPWLVRWHSQAPAHCRASRNPLTAQWHLQKLCESCRGPRSIFRGRNLPE